MDRSKNVRSCLAGAVVLFAGAGIMLLVERENQIPLSALYTLILPACTFILALVFFFRTPKTAGSSERSCSLDKDLLVFSFIVTTGFWVFILGIIEYTTPVGDVGGMLFMITLSPGTFAFWWPGLALALAPEFGTGDKPLDRSRYLCRLATGFIGGLLAGIPLYLFASQLTHVPILGL